MKNVHQIKNCIFADGTQRDWCQEELALLHGKSVKTLILGGGNKPLKTEIIFGRGWNWLHFAWNYFMVQDHYSKAPHVQYNVSAIFCILKHNDVYNQMVWIQKVTKWPTAQGRG